ncbi:MAG TPA: hypothetical protein DD490_13055 [Acidobacteria bacterium]|nr:hypothetical protein [Acidobacteriota bacterium]
MPHIRSLALQVHALATVNSDSFSKLSNSYYDRLFVDLKASFDDSTFAGHDYLETILVKTNTYLRIESQLAYVVIGRKGSGKSTLTQVLPLIHPERYVGIINIVADEFNLESLYSLYSSDSQFRSDADAAVSRDLAFELTWEALLILAMMEVTLELYLQGALSAEDWQISPIAGLFKRIKGESSGSPAEWQVGDFFNYAFSGMIDFVRDCIDEARSEATVFLVDIGVRFDRERYLSFLLGADALAAFRVVMRSLPKRFLVTLDGFDTAFDKFRLQGLRLQDEVRLKKRAHFEIDWLRSLLSLAMSARSKRQDYFYRNLDFCIAAPKDRFMEVMRVDRDSYRHWQRWCTLHWSGVELAILLRKRLEVLASMVTRKEASPRERLEEVLRHRSFRHLPMELDFEYNQRRYRMPLFIYVLRHTFWRPREVLVYYAALLALAEDMRRWGYEVTTDVVRKCIKASTRRIIESEFFNEFHSTVVNIREIAMAFKRRAVILGFDEVKSILFPLDFKFASGGIEELDLVAKVRFLYDVGFLGIKADKALRERFGLDSEDAFYFNEGSTILIGTDEVDLEGWKFIVHPIFCEYLWLDTQDQELTLQFTWDYLHQREAFFSANPGA